MEPEDLLRIVVTVCEAQGLRYLVTGSTATIAYGEPRFTNDIDIVLELHREQIHRFCGAFPESEYYLSRQAVEWAVRSASQFNLIHPASGLKVDFIVYSETEFNQSRMARSRALPVLEDHRVQFREPYRPLFARVSTTSRSRRDTPSASRSSVSGSLLRWT